jgi:hypothetical protein
MDDLEKAISEDENPIAATLRGIYEALASVKPETTAEEIGFWIAEAAFIVAKEKTDTKGAMKIFERVIDDAYPDLPEMSFERPPPDPDREKKRRLRQMQARGRKANRRKR